MTRSRAARLMCTALTDCNDSAADSGRVATERIDYLNTVIRFRQTPPMSDCANRVQRGMRVEKRRRPWAGDR